MCPRVVAPPFSAEQKALRIFRVPGGLSAAAMLALGTSLDSRLRGNDG